MRFQLFVAVLGVATMAGCRPTTTNQSTVTHEFGNTSVAPQGSFLDCNQLGEIDYTSKILPKAQAYIKNIARHITSNNRQTFKGQYDFTKFCFGVIEERVFNAYAYPFHRGVFFHSEALMTANSDAEVAAVMSHELAHVTMQHNSPLTHADYQKSPRAQANPEYAQYDKVVRNEMLPLFDKANKAAGYLSDALRTIAASDAQGKQAVDRILGIEEILETSIIEQVSPTQWQTLTDKLMSAYEDLGGLMDGENGRVAQHYKEELQGYEARIQAAVKRTAGLEEAIRAQARGFVPEEQLHNGSEREADEVGYEFYLRAGIHPSGFHNMLGNLAQMNGETLLGSRAALLECIGRTYIAMRKNIERGMDSHPTGCWRLHNIANTESKDHAKEYGKLLPNATRRTLTTSPSLAEVQAEIRKYRESGASEKATPLEASPKSRKAACTALGGHWDDKSEYCSIPLKPTKAEGDAFCKQQDPNSFYHGPTCFCLPKEWEKEDIDESRCTPRGMKFDQQPFDPNDDGSWQNDNDSDVWQDDDDSDVWQDHDDDDSWSEDNNDWDNDIDLGGTDAVGGDDATDDDDDDDDNTIDWFW